VQWNTGGNPTGTNYTVEFSTTSNFIGTVTSTNTTQLIASSGNLVANNVYYTRIKSKNNNDVESGYLLLGSTATLALPANFTNFIITDIADNSLTIRWDSGGNSPQTQYNIDIATSPDFGNILFTSSTLLVKSTFFGLLQNTTYHFKGGALNQNNLPRAFNTNIATSTLASAPTFNDFGGGDIANTFMTVRWSTASNPPSTRYQVTRSTQAGMGAPTEIKEVVADNVQYTGLAVNLTNYYTALALNNNRLPTAFTNTLTSGTLSNIPVITYFTNVRTNDATVNWTANSNPGYTLYHVEIASDSGFFGTKSSITTTALSYNFTSLRPETTYYYHVRSINSYDLETAFAVSGGSRTRDVAPGNISALTAFSGTNEGEIDLVWTTVGDDGTLRNFNDSAYRIKYQQTDFTSFTEGDSYNLEITTTNIEPGKLVGRLIAGLVKGATYYFAVIAKDDVGNWSEWNKSGINNTDNWAKAKDIAPGIVKDVTAVKGEGQVIVSWGANIESDLAGYRIYMDSIAPANLTGPFPFIATVTVSSNTLRHTFTDMTVNNKYFFYVTALDLGAPITADPGDALESTESLVVTTRPVSGPFPPFSFVNNVVSSTTITWQWVDNSIVEDEYRLFNATTGAQIATISAVLNSGTTPSYQESGLDPNVEYARYVVAYKVGIGSSAPTNIFSTYTYAAQPVNSFLTGITSTSLILNWQNGANPPVPGTTYYAQAALDSAFQIGVQSSQTVTLSAELKPLAGNSTYYFRVAAINRNKIYSPYTSAISSMTLAAPGSFTAFNASIVEITSMTVRWSAQGNSTYTLYRISVSTAVDFSGDLSTHSTYGLQISTWGLLSNLTHYFRGESIDNQGRHTTFGSDTFYPTEASSPTPSAITLVTSGTLTANWGPATNTPGTWYIAEISVSSTFPSIYASSFTSSLSARIENLIPNTTYSVRVKARQWDSVDSQYTFLGTTKTLASPNYFTVFDPADVKADTITVRWAQSNNPIGTRYRIEMATSSNFGGPLVSTVSTALQYPYTGLLFNTTYYFRGTVIDFLDAETSFTLQRATATMPNQASLSIFSGVGEYVFRSSWSQAGNPASVYYENEISTDSLFSVISQTSSTYISYANFSGLIPETTYYSRVRAINYNKRGTGFTALGSTFTHDVPPDNISDLTALATTLDGEALLQWTSPGDNTDKQTLVSGSYRIMISTNDFDLFSSTMSYDIAFTTDGVNPGTAVGRQLNQLESGATVYFAVITEDERGNWSSWNRSGSVNPANWTLVFDSAPQKISNLGGVTGDALVETSWDPVPDHDLDFYRIYESSYSISEGFVLLGTTVVTKWVSSGLDVSNTYYYYVTAVDKGAPDNNGQVLEGERSYIQVVASTKALIPGVVLWANPVALSTHSIQWNWCDQAISEDGYNLINPDFPSVFITTTTSVFPIGNPVCGDPQQFRLGNTTAYIETGLLENTSYSRRIRVFKDSNVSTSVVIGVYTFSPPPNDLAFDNVTSTSITTSWSASFASAYRVDHSTDNINWIFLSTVTVLTYTDNAILPGSSYYHRIGAINNGGILNTDYYSNVTSTISLPLTPASFTGVALSTTSIYWSWINTSLHEGLRIYDSSSTQLLVQLGPNTTEYLETSLAVDFSTSRVVKAYNGRGESGASNSVTVYTLSNPPTSFAVVSITTGSVSLSWGANNNQPNTRYGLENSTDNAIWTLVDDQIRVTTHTASSLADNLTYFFRLRAFNGDALVSTYVYVASHTLPNVPNDIPASLTARSLPSHTIIWSWQDSATNEDGYRLVSTTGGSISGDLGTNVTTYSQISLSPNVSYSIYVQIFNNSTALNSAVLSTYTLANAAVGLSFSNIQTKSVELSWGANSNPVSTNYKVRRYSNTGTLLATLGPTTGYSLNDSPILEGTTYQYSVVSENGNNVGVATLLSPALTPRITPNNVTDLVAGLTQQEGVILLSWTPPGG